MTCNQFVSYGCLASALVASGLLWPRLQPIMSFIWHTWSLNIEMLGFKFKVGQNLNYSGDLE